MEVEETGTGIQLILLREACGAEVFRYYAAIWSLAVNSDQPFHHLAGGRDG
jgi:hypothetical protein